MCCLVALGGLLFPRVALFLVWLFNQSFINDAYPNLAVPILGFIFLPLTTLAYAWTFTFEGGPSSGAGVIVIVIAVLIDIGSWGGGATRRPAPRRS